MITRLISSFIIVIFMAGCQNEESSREEDVAKLQKMLAEINEISLSVPCNNTAEWRYTCIGSKACGGPQFYIAYSSRIDTVKFINMVHDYTRAEGEFNLKWGVISDCAIVQKPKSVVCQNGLPVLIY